MSRNKKDEERVEVDESETIKNYEYSVKIMRKVLQLLGMWPMTSPTYSNFLRLFVIVVMCVLLAIFVTPIGLYIFLIVEDFKERVRRLGPFNFGLLNAIKFATLIKRRSDFRNCLDWMLNDWRNTKTRVENNLMLASARTGVTFTLLCMSIMWVSSMTYSSIFSFIQERVIVNNVSRMAFAYPAYFVFFEPYDHFYKVYLIQSLCGFAAFTLTPAIASVAIALTMHVCGQISVVTYLLQNIATHDVLDKKAFRYIIQKHLRALRLAKKVEDLLSSICLLEMLGSCSSICITGYYIVMEFDFYNPGPYTYCLLMISFVFNVFIYCYIGEQLFEQCSNVRNIVYNVDWYDLSPKDSRNLLLIITSTSHPVVLTAGKMANLSMRSFSNVMKASLSYLNMLRAVTTS